MGNDARQDPAAAALGAYWRFFEGWNSRTAAGWSDGLNFPHVRVSHHSEVRVVKDRAAHDATMSWDSVQATGWDHSVGAAPQVLHVSPDVVHLQGGWTRFTKSEQPILTNHVMYVITRMLIDGSERWGMQARFGIDSGAAGLSETTGASAVQVVDDYLDAWNAKDFVRCAGLMHYPVMQVLPGEIRESFTADAFAARLANAGWLRINNRTLRAAQAGPDAVNVAIDMTLEREEQAIFFVTQRDGRWGIQGRSIIEH